MNGDDLNPKQSRYFIPANKDAYSKITMDEIYQN